MRNPITLLMLLALWGYKKLISPLLYVFGVRCRHEPSCSSYSRQAIVKHGPWAGGWMTLARLLRCHPYGTYGVDNVPEHVTKPPIWAPWRYGVWRLDNKRDEHGHDNFS